MRSLPRLLAVATLLAASALTTPAFAAGIDADLAAAENSYAALDFPNAVSLAEGVLAQHGLSHDVLTRATRVAALSHAALGHVEQAKQQFVLLLQYDFDFKVDARLGPRFNEPFSEARGYWQAQSRKPGMDAEPSIQYDQPGVVRVVTRDPLSVVKRVVVGYRWAPAHEFVVVPVGGTAGQVDVPANPPGSTRFEYYVRALDSRNDAVFEAGSPETPKSLLIAAPARAVVSEKRSPVVPILLIGGGVLAAAAAVGAFFLFRPTAYQSSSTGRGALGASCAGARCD